MNELRQQNLDSEKEIQSEKESDLAAFKSYVAAHEAEIESERAGGRSLWKIFYNNFYTHDVDAQKYQDDDPGFQKIQREYDEKNRALLEESMNRERFDGSYVWRDVNWLYANIYEISHGATHNRFYLNIKPEYLADFFKETVKLFRDANLPAQIKIPITGNPGEFARSDKMVIYIDPENRDTAELILSKLYRENTFFFEDAGTPKFTEKLSLTGGSVIKSIGFGESPRQKRTSFGIIRSMILADVYERALSEGYLPSDDQFNFEEAFNKACIKFDVDPDHPAYNLKTSE